MKVGELFAEIKLKDSAFRQALNEIKKLGDSVSKQVGKDIARNIQQGLNSSKGIGAQVGRQIGADIRNGIGGATKGIKGDLQGALRSLNFNVALGPLQGLNTSFSALGLTAGAALGVAAAGLRGLGSAFGTIIDTGKEFSAQMSTVASVAFAGMDQQSAEVKNAFAALEKQAMDLGATTSFTATQVGEAQELLARAGFSVNETLQATPGLLAAAAAEGLDLATTADISSSALRGFGLEASQMNMVADLLAQTSATSNASIRSLGESFKYIAPVAQAVKLDIVDVNAALGLLSNMGIKGSVAGRNLASGLMSLAKPSAEAKRLMDELNISVSNADGTFKSLPDLFTNLENAVTGFSDAQALSNLTLLVGKDNAKTYLALLNSQYKTTLEDGTEVTLSGADALETYSEALKGSAGAAEQMANIRLDNLEGDLTLLKSAADGLSISLFKQLEPSFRAVAQGATALIQFVGPPLVQAFGAAQTIIQSVAQNALPGLTQAWNSLQPAIASAMSVLRQVLPVFAVLVSDAAKWGGQIVAQLAAGMSQAIQKVVAVLKYIGSIIRYWLKPNSPPKIVPELDQYGRDVGQVYIDAIAQVDATGPLGTFGRGIAGAFKQIGQLTAPAAEQAGQEAITAFARGMGNWSASDFAAFDELNAEIEETIRQLGESGNIAKDAIVPAIQASRDALTNVIDDIKEFGYVTEESMAALLESVGPLAPEIQGLVDAYADLQSAARDVAEAQEELNRVTEEYNAKISPLQEELNAINAEQKRIRDMQRIQKLQEDLASGKLDENEARLAELEIQEILKKQQIDAIEKEKDAATEAAEEKLKAAEAQQTAAQAAYDAQLAQLNATQTSNSLMQEQVRILQELAEAQRNAAGAAAGGGGGGLGDIGGGLGGMPDLALDGEDPLAGFQESIGQFEEAFSGISETIDTFKQDIDNARSVVDTLYAKFNESGSVFSGLNTNIAGVGNFVNQYLIPPITMFADLIVSRMFPTLQGLGNQFQTVLLTNAGPAWETFKGILAGLQPVIDVLYLGIQGFIAGTIGFITGLVGMVSGALPGLAAVVQGAMQGIQATIQLFTGTFSGIIDIIANLIAGNWSGAWDAAWGIVINAVDSIKLGIEGLYNQVMGIVSALVGGVLGFFNGVYSAITGDTTNFTNNVVLFFDDMRTRGVAVINNLYKQIIKWFTDLFSGVKRRASKWVTDTSEQATELKDKLITAATDMYNKVLEWFTKLGTEPRKEVEKLNTAISNMASEFLKTAEGIGKSVVDGLVGGLKDGVERVKKAARDLANSIPGPIKKLLGIASPAKVLIEYGEYASLGLAIGLGNGIPDITRSIELIANTVLMGLAKLRDDATILFEDIGDLFKGELDSIQNAISGLSGIESLLPSEKDVKAAKEAYQSIADSIAEQQDKIIQIAEDLNNRRKELNDELVDLEKETSRKIYEEQKSLADKLISLRDKQARIDEKIAKAREDTEEQKRIREELNRLQTLGDPNDELTRERINALSSRLREIDADKEEKLQDLLADRKDILKDIEDAELDSADKIADLKAAYDEKRLNILQQIAEAERKADTDKEAALQEQLRLMHELRAAEEKFLTAQNLYNSLQRISEVAQTTLLNVKEQLKGLEAIDPNRSAKIYKQVQDSVLDLARAQQELLEERTKQDADPRRIKILEDQAKLLRQAAEKEFQLLQQNELQSINEAIAKEAKLKKEIADQAKSENPDAEKRAELERQLATLQAQIPLLQQQADIIRGLNVGSLLDSNAFMAATLAPSREQLPLLGQDVLSLLNTNPVRSDAITWEQLMSRFMQQLGGGNNINYVVNATYNQPQSALSVTEELKLLAALRGN